MQKLDAQPSQPALTLSDLDTAIHLDPDCAEAHYNRGILHGMTGHYACAVNDFSQALLCRVDPDTPGSLSVVALTKRAGAYYELGLFDRCIQDCSRALDLYAKHSEAYFIRSRAYMHVAQVDLALRDCNLAIACDANNGWYHLCRAAIRLLLQQPYAAQQDFARAAALAPQDSERIESARKSLMDCARKLHPTISGIPGNSTRVYMH